MEDMKRRSLLLIAAVLGFAVLFAAVGIAGTAMEDTIVFKPTAGEGKYQDRTVTFTHKKHIEEHKLTCGECHHDKDGKPRADLKAGDDVQKCSECHSKPGEAPKDKKMEWRKQKLSKQEQQKLSLEYRAEAFHANCVTCHKEHNRKNKTKAAPQACTQCHEK
jgi:hypothetical protein